MVIPHGVSRLTSLNKLLLPTKDGWGRRSSCAIGVKDLANLRNLMELEAVVKPEIKERTMTTWTEMRKLSLYFPWMDGNDRDDVEEDILPLNMENMKKLERFSLYNYQGVSLPDCISQYQNLRDLSLYFCPKLRALPACEIGNEIAGGGFPMLKELILDNLRNLESIVTSEETMSELVEIHISGCRSLKRLGMKKLAAGNEALEIGSGGLPMLEELSLTWVGKFQITVGPAGVINDEVMPKLQYLEIAGCSSLKILDTNLRRVYIDELEIGRGGFPMLQRLVLFHCKNLESMVGPSDVWNEETMPRLEVLEIFSCRLLRRLPRGIEKLSKLKQIIGELEWWESIIWEDNNVKMKLSHLFHCI